MYCMHRLAVMCETVAENNKTSTPAQLDRRPQTDQCKQRTLHVPADHQLQDSAGTYLKHGGSLGVPNQPLAAAAARHMKLALAITSVQYNNSRSEKHPCICRMSSKGLTKKLHNKPEHHSATELPQEWSKLQYIATCVHSSGLARALCCRYNGMHCA